MFRQLARILQALTPPVNIFSLHPLQLARALEQAWVDRTNNNPAPTAPGFEPRLPGGVGNPAGLLDWLRWPVGREGELAIDGGVPVRITAAWLSLAVPNKPTPVWDHLIYAYLIENTRVYEIFRRVLWEYQHGERLNAPPSDLWPWLRATEELFYATPPPFQIISIRSDIRADIRASRRNAYYRVFGLDLNHPGDDGRPYPFEKPERSNRDFVQLFEDLLREVRRGIENAGNTSGPNPTDDSVLEALCRSIQNRLVTRRLNGNLSREEFVHVSTMSWFHLSLDFDDSPIVRALQAQGANAAERLQKIGERVGVPAHAKSDSYFILADPMSRILVEMERGAFLVPGAVRNLYLQPATPPPAGTTTPRDDMSTIITHWSIATGRDIKAPAVRVTALPQPQAPAVRVSSENGRVTAPASV